MPPPPPRIIEVHVLRNDAVSDPFGFRERELGYHRVLAGGGVRETTFRWPGGRVAGYWAAQSPIAVALDGAPSGDGCLWLDVTDSASGTRQDGRGFATWLR